MLDASLRGHNDLQSKAKACASVPQWVVPPPMAVLSHKFYSLPPSKRSDEEGHVLVSVDFCQLEFSRKLANGVW